MVAEKKGVIRMYSTLSLQPFMSLDCGHTPLVSADWSLTNELRVAALAGTDWFVFDTSRSRFSTVCNSIIIIIIIIIISDIIINASDL